jgi:hypothetical protein
MHRENPLSEQPPAGGFQLRYDAWGRLVMCTDDGQEHVGVEPTRLFPLSEPDRWIALCDSAGREIVCLPSLDHLSPETQEILLEEISQREFLPHLLEIEKVSSVTEPSEWHVQTDRGPVVFRLDNEDDVHRLGACGAVIIDAHGIRYLVPDIEHLDGHSRRILDRYL